MIEPRQLRFSTALALWLLSSSTTAFCVVVAGGDGSQNTTAPPEDFGFRNVGRIDSGGFIGSCVYLGGGWVLTAYHLVDDFSGGFRLGQVILRDQGGTDRFFTPDPSTANRLRNEDGTLTDLALFRLGDTPTFLNNVVISTVAPASGSSVILVGNGSDRSAGLTHWDVDSSETPDVWTEVDPPPPPDRSGYELASSQAVRWGTNTVEPGTSDIDSGYGIVRSIRTDFDNLSGEAQGVVGDSGGALFYKAGSTWELAGLIHAVSVFDGQPSAAVFGNQTFAADLSAYRVQIQSIPEPAGPLLLLLALGCCFGASRPGRANTPGHTE